MVGQLLCFKAVDCKCELTVLLALIKYELGAELLLVGNSSSSCNEFPRTKVYLLESLALLSSAAKRRVSRPVDEQDSALRSYSISASREQIAVSATSFAPTQLTADMSVLVARCYRRNSCAIVWSWCTSSVCTAALAAAN
jgi:hypothetical protein